MHIFPNCTPHHEILIPCISIYRKCYVYLCTMVHWSIQPPLECLRFFIPKRTNSCLFGNGGYHPHQEGMQWKTAARVDLRDHSPHSPETQTEEGTCPRSLSL